MSADVDDGAQRQDDQSEEDQQHHQVAVEHAPARAVEAALVKAVQDEGPDPPGGGDREPGRLSLKGRNECERPS